MTDTKISSNGGSRYQSDKVRVAIIGVGNCASSLGQGVEFYKDADPKESVPGLMHVDLGGYHISDIEFRAAFDTAADKVGTALSEAIWSGQNNTIKFADVPNLGVPVHRGMTHDGLGKYLKEKIEKAPGETADIVQILKETKTDVVVSYLPVGSEQATKWYVEQILEAGCAFVNCIPVFIAKEAYWAKRFEKAGLPIIGDDIKSQVGATIVHRQLARLFGDRGVKMVHTSQLNVGGNMDFYNMLERERLESKKISKTNAVTSIMDHELPADDVYIGPSDYVPWLTDRKWAHIRLEGQAFGDVPLMAELKLEVWDSPNSAGIVIDAVRCCKLALNHGVAGQLDGPSSYLMKSPHNQRPDHLAREATEQFIAEHARSKRAAKTAGRAGDGKSTAVTEEWRRTAAVRLPPPCPSASPSPRSRRIRGRTSTRSTRSSTRSRVSWRRRGTASSCSPPRTRRDSSASRAAASGRATCSTRTAGCASSGSASCCRWRARGAARCRPRRWTSRGRSRRRWRRRRRTSSTSTSRSLRAPRRWRCATRGR